MIPAYDNPHATTHQDAIREAMLRLCRAEGHKAGVPNKMGLGVALVPPRRERDRRAEILAALTQPATVHHIKDVTGINNQTARNILEELFSVGLVTREKFRRGRTTFWVYQKVGK